MELSAIISSVVQGLSTVILVAITWHYVRLTKQLVDLQIEPRLDFDIPNDILQNSNYRARLVNNSRCAVDSVTLQASVGYRQADGNPSPIMTCIDSRSWDTPLNPKRELVFDMSHYFNIATEIGATHDIPENMELIRGLVLLSVSFRRTADGKEFCFQEPYSVIPQQDGKATVSKSGPRQHMDSLEHWIATRKES